jgi:hypothetical protein
MQGDRKRRAGLIMRLVSALVLLSGTLVAGAERANAVVSCGAGCPVSLTEDAYTVQYKASGQTLIVDKAHGVLSNDEGPSTTVVDLPDTVDDFASSQHRLTTDNGFTVNINKDGSFTYQTDGTFSGDDTFVYAAWDSLDHDNYDFNQATITITPVIGTDTYYTATGSLSVPAPGAYQNDAGIDTDTATLDGVSTRQGAVTDNGSGAFTYDALTGFQGKDSFGYEAYDLNFDNVYNGTVTVWVDSIRPSVAMTAPTSALSLSPNIPLHWGGSDNSGGSGITHYDVQRNTGVWNGQFLGWTNWMMNTTATSATFPGTYGRSYCFRTRAVDRAGNASPWAMRCTSVPLKAGSLSYSSGWTTSTSSAYFGGAARLTKTGQARASLSGVVAKHLWLVVTKCASCGTVQVRWNGVVKANINLASSTTKHGQLVAALSLPSAQKGTLSLYNATAGRYLVLEGVDVYLH